MTVRSAPRPSPPPRRRSAVNPSPPPAETPAAGATLWARAVRDLKAGGKKTVVLGLLCVAAAYVWAPQVGGALGIGSDESPPDPPPPPDFAAPPEPAPAAPAAPGGADPAAADDLDRPLDAAAVFERVAADRRLRPAGPEELARDPFTPQPLAEVAAWAVNEAPAEIEPPAVAAPAAGQVAGWLPLAGTLSGAGGGAVLLGGPLAGRVAAVGETVEAGGHRFAVKSVAPGSAVVVWAPPGGPPAGRPAEYRLTLPEPDDHPVVRTARAAPAAGMTTPAEDSP